MDHSRPTLASASADTVVPSCLCQRSALLARNRALSASGQTFPQSGFSAFPKMRCVAQNFSGWREVSFLQNRNLWLRQQWGGSGNY